jgi:enolase
MVTVVQKKNYEASQFDDEWVILNTDEYTVTKVNEVGGFCWTLLESEQTIESIAQAVRKKFEIEDVQVAFEQDIEDFLTELHQYGLVSYVG